MRVAATEPRQAASSACAGFCCLKLTGMCDSTQTACCFVQKLGCMRCVRKFWKLFYLQSCRKKLEAPRRRCWASAPSKCILCCGSRVCRVGATGSTMRRMGRGVNAKKGLKCYQKCKTLSAEPSPLLLAAELPCYTRAVSGAQL